MPDRECIVFRDRRLSYAEVGDRTRRLANALRDRGLGRVAERTDVDGRPLLERHVSGQDHVALYLHNGNEYLEGMLGAYKARMVPFNVNYRYVAEELEYLLRDAGATAIVFHSTFARTLDEVRDRLPELRGPVAGARRQRRHAARRCRVVRRRARRQLEPTRPGAARLVVARRPVHALHRRHDGAAQGRAVAPGRHLRRRPRRTAPRQPRGVDLDRRDRRDTRRTAACGWSPARRSCTAPRTGWPSTASRTPTRSWCPGWSTTSTPTTCSRLIEREQGNVLLIVGDAFGRPLVEAMERGDHELSSLLVTITGGAALSAGVKERLLAAVPTMMVHRRSRRLRDGSAGEPAHLGGAIARRRAPSSPDPACASWTSPSRRCCPRGTPRRAGSPRADGCRSATSATRTRPLRTFPTIDGVRYSVPGDRARLTADGVLELYGRDSVTINSGGEKIFAEEVEQAVLAHPSVADCLVAGRPSERWGHEVVAVVQLVDGVEASDDDLLEEAARHVARYKLPKHVVRVEPGAPGAVGQGRLPLGPGHCRGRHRLTPVEGRSASRRWTPTRS